MLFQSAENVFIINEVTNSVAFQSDIDSDTVCFAWTVFFFFYFNLSSLLFFFFYMCVSIGCLRLSEEENMLAKTSELVSLVDFL